ncbi:MAG: hypothetical protein AB9879_05125 [Methanothrix sp.]
MGRGCLAGIRGERVDRWLSGRLAGPRSLAAPGARVHAPMQPQGQEARSHHGPDKEQQQQNKAKHLRNNRERFLLLLLP